MTAVDLTARLDEIEARLPRGLPRAQLSARERDAVDMLAALREVLGLHTPGSAYGVTVCTVCSQVKDADEWDDPSSDYAPIASWLTFPCPTVAAIRSALGGAR